MKKKKLLVLHLINSLKKTVHNLLNKRNDLTDVTVQPYYERIHRHISNARDN